MKQPIFKGICTALVTPFNKDLSIDFNSFAKLIEYQIESKVGALLFMGTTGEASTLTITEKKQIAEFAIKIVNKRVPIIIGVGGNNPAGIIEFGKWLPRCIDGVLLSNPYYNKTTDAGLVKFFHDIANEIKLPVIAYNVPGRTGQNITPAVFAKTCENPWIVGIKEASGNMTQIMETMRQCPNVAVYSGDDALTLPTMAVGGAGVISVAGNIKPDYLKYNSLELLPLFNSLFCEVNPIPVKYALSKMGLIKNYLRPPLLPLSKSKYNDIIKACHL